MYLCRTLTDVALSVIGKKIGNRDHTTVIHGYEKIQKEMEKNEKVKKDLETSMQRVRNELEDNYLKQIIKD